MSRPDTIENVAAEVRGLLSQRFVEHLDLYLDESELGLAAQVLAWGLRDSGATVSPRVVETIRRVHLEDGLDPRSLPADLDDVVAR